ncbi:MAG: M10 family metallopeptidase C-terminal domain-containing protein [Pseudomonas proteolytica]|uniref:M10 family metallopeptidase C-terminal domain-containing protein n=1 Tax=Pseudomonas proteolytica TaxID=219574 RepID=UPI003F387C28
MSNPTFTISPFASHMVRHLDRDLHHDQRGGDRQINGKPSYSVQQAADEITRDNARWHDTNNDGKTDVAYQFLTAPGRLFRGLGLSGFSEFNQAQKASAQMAMEHLSDVANVRFMQASPDVREEGRLTFGNFDSSTGGENAFATALPAESYQRYLVENPRVPRYGAVSQVWVAATDQTHTAPSHVNEGHMTYAHESGHGVGLSHPFRSLPTGSSYDTATYAQDSHGYSIMSYWSERHTGQSFVKDGVNHSPSTPMVDDVAAIQKLYGANHETRAGDTTYGFNSNAGREAYSLNSSADAPVFTVWDGGGVDTLDFSGFHQNQVINLNEGAPSDVGGMKKNVFIAKGTTIENAKGGAGNDIFISNLTQNILTGGGGKNTYLFLSAEQSTPEQPDRITDFVSGRDKIDISNLRATGPESTYVDEQEFTAVDEALHGAASAPRHDIAEKPLQFTHRFTGQGRQAILTHDPQAQQSTLQLDLNGDRHADFLLKIDTEQPLEGEDFKF